jgi:hypothetical protein
LKRSAYAGERSQEKRRMENASFVVEMALTRISVACRVCILAQHIILHLYGHPSSGADSLGLTSI